MAQADALMPRYATRFECIGTRCEDNCCTGWRVTVDRKTYGAYRASAHPPLADRFAEGVRRQRSGGSPEQYATIELRAGSRECVFLEERLCSIQRELGADKLSNTCAEYPRIARRTAQGIEQSLTLSCPEAARLALLADDALDFVGHRIDYRRDSMPRWAPRPGWSPAQIELVRVFCLQLMQTRELQVWERLAVLGLLCERLQGLEHEGRGAGAAALVEEFTALVAEGGVSALLADLQPFHEIQAQALFGLWLSRGRATGSEHQEEVRRAVLRGLGAEASTDGGQESLSADVVVAHYVQGLRRLPEALAQAPSLMTNYLLNDMFREAFPFADGAPFAQYQRLLVRFGMVRLLLVARCNAAGAGLPSAQDLAATVQVFCRRHQHDPSFARALDQVLANAGWDRLDRLWRFLKT
jgi:lysine-N-methylase